MMEGYSGSGGSRSSKSLDGHLLDDNLCQWKFSWSGSLPDASCLRRSFEDGDFHAGRFQMGSSNDTADARADYTHFHRW